jgi:pimeloyl-ACP methyl ester carboxylesterase
MSVPAPVVVVHGLWLNGLEFFLLNERLRAAGFAPASFRYHSLHATLAQAADALAAQLREQGATAHVVAHSLGGVIACEAFDRHPDLPAGRIVLLGSPIQGSRAAQAVATRWYGAGVLGPLAVAELASSRQRTWKHTREIALIAGSRSAGLGRIFADLPLPNDGTVCVDETALPGASAHTVLDVTHTGMLLSRKVADSTIGFLRDGALPHNGA